MVNKGYPEGLALIVKKCKNGVALNRYATSTYRDRESFGNSAQLVELDFLIVLAHRGHDIERVGESTPPVFE